MTSPPSRRQTALYVLAVGALALLTILLLYTVFSAGLVAGIESFLADPSGTLVENPGSFLAVGAIFLSLFALLGTVVLAGARHIDEPGRRS